MRQRITGSRVITDLQGLETMDKEQETTQGGSRHKIVKTSEVQDVIDKIFKNEGLVFNSSIYANENQAITFKPVPMERQGTGNLDNEIDNSISSFGRWTFSGKGNTEWLAEIPVDLYADNQRVVLANGSASYVLRFSGSTAMRQAYYCELASMMYKCLNGMRASHSLMRVSHKHTTQLSIEGMLIKGLESASKNYKGLQNDITTLQNTAVTNENMAVFFHSGIMNGILSGSNVKEITNYYNDLNNGYFENKEQTAYRLFNAVTLFANKQGSLQVKNHLTSKLYWPLSDAGLFPKDQAHYPSNYHFLKTGGTPIKVNENQIDIPEEHYQVLS